jgi:hypothetical protein
MDSFPLVAGSATTIPKLEISYDEQPLSTLSVSRLYLWNSGNRTIRVGDLDHHTKYHLRVETSHYCTEILDIDDSVYMSEPASKIWAGKASSNGSPNLRVDLGFRYLEPNKGGIFRIYHTGRGEDPLGVKGKVIGGAICHSQSPPQLPRLVRRWEYSGLSTTLIFGGLILLLSLESKPENIYMWMLTGVMMIGAILTFALEFQDLRNRSHMPRDLAAHSRWDDWLWLQ